MVEDEDGLVARDERLVGMENPRRWFTGCLFGSNV
jgi:hypothetical protein